MRVQELAFASHVIWSSHYGDLMFLYTGVALLPRQAVGAGAVSSPGVTRASFALALCQGKKQVGLKKHSHKIRSFYSLLVRKAWKNDHSAPT